jgi:5-(aminomethyl)-3-furanmethanol phosphate kinase
MEAVIKVGGSIAEHPEALKTLCKKLNKIAKKHRLLIVPGGGEFADVVRGIEKRFATSAYVSHKMAVLGMDQFGLLLSELIPNGIAIASLEKAKDYWKSETTPVFLPSKMMFREEPLEASWDVTSDSIAAFVASRVKADIVILAKDVDGIFSDDPKENSEAKLIKEISVSALSKMRGKTAVDRYLPRLLRDKCLDCYVVNGLYPDRIMQVLDGEETTCTLIASK